MNHKMENFKPNNDLYVHFSNNGGIFKEEKKIIKDVIHR